MLWTVTPWNWSSRTRRSGKTGKSSSWVTVTHTGEEYEQECDVESGMDILNFILSQKSFECYE